MMAIIQRWAGEKDSTETPRMGFIAHFEALLRVYSDLVFRGID